MAEGSSNTDVDLSMPLVTSSDIVFDYNCTVCQEDEQYQAVGYCSDCTDYLCQDCFNIHCRPRPMRHHTLLDKDSMPKDKDNARRKNGTSKDKCTEACPNHADKVIEYICPAHDALGCNVCSTIDHRNCPGLTYIPDIANDVFNTEEFKQLIKNLDTMTDCTSKIIDVANDNIILFKQFHSDTLQSLKEFRNEVNVLLDELENDIKAQAEKIKSEDVNNLTKASIDCSNVLKEINSTRSRFASLQNDKKYCSAFVALKKIKTTLQSVQRRLDKAEEYTKIKYYKFQPNFQLTQFLQGKDAIGKISLTEPEDNAQCVLQSDTHASKTPSMREGTPGKVSFLNKEEDSDAAENNQIPSDLKTSEMRTTPLENVIPVDVLAHAQHVGDIHVRSSDDKGTCRITGSVFLADDTLVVTDFGYTNNTVKVVDIKTNKLITCIQVPSLPWDITAITSNQVAVTLPLYHEILFFTLTKRDTLTEERKIQVNGDCHGIVYTRDRLIVSFVDPGKVEILTLNGDVQRSISTDTTGRRLFTRPLYIAVSHDQDTLYVSDNDNDSITSLSLTGQIKAVFKDDLLVNPTGLVTNSKGGVYICGWGSSNMHVIMANCDKMKVILSRIDELKNPYTVSYCENTNMLFVGQYQCDSIKMYQLT